MNRYNGHYKYSTDYNVFLLGAKNNFLLHYEL